MKITALAGGVGGAKLLVGLQRLAGRDLTAIVNTADDSVIYSVHVSPDIDIVTYWLAGLADTERGWGLRDDTFRIVEGLGALGEANWFSLGDRDFATCLLRTERMRAGQSLTSITDEIARALGVEARILPMSDDPVRTMIHTSDGRTLAFQEYFVKERTAPEVERVELRGIADAKPAPGVIEAITSAEIAILCPSNPFLSLAPILGLPGVRSAIVSHPKVAVVSPIVGGAAIKGPADRLMRKLGGGSSAANVAALYADLCDLFVFDESDAAELPAIERLGPSSLATDTLMVDADASERLATTIGKAFS